MRVSNHKPLCSRQQEIGHENTEHWGSDVLSSNIVRLERIVRKLRNELAESQRAANEQEDNLNVIIKLLRVGLESHETSSSTFMVALLRFPYQHLPMRRPINTSRGNCSTTSLPTFRSSTHSKSRGWHERNHRLSSYHSSRTRRSIKCVYSHPTRCVTDIRVC